MNKKTILWVITTIILSIAIFYGVLYYLQWQDKKEWERMKKEKQSQQEESTQEEKELNIQREEAKKRLNPETGELIQTEEESKELEILRLEAEKRIEVKESTTQQSTTQTQTTPQAEELTLEQRREEAMKRLQNQ